MSPALTASLTLAGAIIAGLPLLWLTAPPPAQTQQTGAADSPGMRQVHATLSFSGKPEKIVLYHAAEEIAAFTALTAQQHLTLQLPVGDSIEIEYDVQWPEDSEGMQGCTLRLEPEGMESREKTMWTMPGENRLYDIFYFQW